MTRHLSPALIGSFVVSGIVLLVAGVIIFGSGRAFDETRTFVSFFPGSVNGLAVGANVTFRGVPVGTVREVLLQMDMDPGEIGMDSRIPVVFDIDETLIEARGGRLDLSDTIATRRLLEQGMSAQLASESLLTGRLFVSLDFRPDQEILLYGGEHEYPEIPTVTSPMADLQAKVRELGDRFATVDLEHIFTTLRTTLDGVNGVVTSSDMQSLPADIDGLVANLDETSLAIRHLAASVDTTIGPTTGRLHETAGRAEASMAEVDETLKSLQTVMAPEAPLVVGLVQTLRELELAARSLRRVAEMVERDPAILIRGRDPGDGS